MKSLQSKKFLFITFSLVLVALTRFLPHPPNFTAVGAMAIFGGALYTSWLMRILLPLAIMFITDLVINNVMYASAYDGFAWATSGAAYIYGAIVLMVVLGQLIAKSSKLKDVALASVLGSLVFFLITNFGVWASPMSMYPQSFDGLLASYTAGLPFLINNMVSTLLFSGVLFGAYFFASSKLEAKPLKVRS